MVHCVYRSVIVLSVIFLNDIYLICGAHSWKSTESLSVANSSDVVPHDADSSRLGYIKVGLAAAFFFTVLVSCGLPVLLIDYLKERNNLSPNNKNRRFHLGRVQQNESNQIKIEDQDDDEAEDVEFQYCDLNLSPNAEEKYGNCLNDGQFSENKEADTSLNRISLQHQNSLESEVPSTPGQSPNPALLSGDQFENRDLLTGQVVHSERNWPHSFRIQDRIRGRNLNDPSFIASQRAYQKQGKQKFFRRVISSRASRKETLQIWFSRCNCFAAGVFLSSGFMELYPDTEEAITEAKHQLNIKSEFPFAPFLTLVGFFLVLSIEQIVWTTKSRHSICCRRRNSNNNNNNSQTLHRDLLHSVSNDYNLEKNRNHYVVNNTSKNNNSNNSNNNNNNDSVTPECSKLYQNNMGYTSSKPVVVGNAKRPSKLSNATNSSELTTIDRSPTSSTHSGNDFLLESGNARIDQVENVKIEPCNDFDDDYDDDGDNHNHHHHSHTHDIKFDAKSFGSVLRIILLLCAMSVHSIFEGLAVGLQPTAQRTLALFTAILLHKVIIAIGIGVNLATNLNESSTPATSSSSSSQARSSYCRMFMYQSIGTLILAFSSPFGVLVGYGLMQQKQSAVLTMSTAILQGLACGTFFYVVFCELLPVEFKEGVKDRMGKFFFLLLGFMLVALYAFLMPE